MDELKLLIAGDLCMRELQNTGEKSYTDKLYEKLRPIFSATDFRIVNLENPVLEDGQPIHKCGPALRANPVDLCLLTEGGFDCAILANNHIGDYGPEGVLSTLRELESRGLAHTGAGKNDEEAGRPWIAEKNGVRFAVIAQAEHEFGTAEKEKAGATEISLLKLFHQIKALKQEVDFVIAVFHGGNEYNPFPSPDAKDRYRLIADFGADAVIGMHPHCPQGYEVYNGKPIFYSTGNFLFRWDTYAADSAWYFGYLPIITLTKEKSVSFEIVPYRFDPDCTQITPLEHAEKDTFIGHLSRISECLNNPEKHQMLFQAWCLHAGVPYAKRFLCFKMRNITNPKAYSKRRLLGMRNLLTCQAHNELMRELMDMIINQKVEPARRMLKELLDSQKILK